METNLKKRKNTTGGIRIADEVVCCAGLLQPESEGACRYERRYW